MIQGRPICEGECKRPIPVYENVPFGYDSPEIWKIDDKAVGGRGGYRIKKKTLCKECYRRAWSRVYPDIPHPI